jgi:hypothetical protein
MAGLEQAAGFAWVALSMVRVKVWSKVFILEKIAYISASTTS